MSESSFDPLPGQDKKLHHQPSDKSDAWVHVYGGTQLAITVLLGFFLGYKVDQWLGWSPWAMLTGAAFGLGIGFYNFLCPLFSNESKK